MRFFGGARAGLAELTALAAWAGWHRIAHVFSMFFELNVLGLGWVELCWSGRATISSARARNWQPYRGFAVSVFVTAPVCDKEC